MMEVVLQQHLEGNTLATPGKGEEQKHYMLFQNWALHFQTSNTRQPVQDLLDLLTIQINRDKKFGDKDIYKTS